MIYLDNASTTKPSAEAIEAAEAAFEAFGNPSSLHRMGMDAEKLVKDARQAVASVLDVSGKNIYFTSGGTEANNTAILGYVQGNRKRGNHIVTTKIEHPSVLEPFRYLERLGVDVTYVGVKKNGEISLDEFEAALREDTILVSVMAVNNETGTVQHVERLKEIMKEKSQKAVLHSDCVQAFCKIPIYPQKTGIDMLSLSSHKIHGLKGAGALYAGDGINIKPIVFGGGQERNLRSGTENTAGIAAFGAAVKSFKRVDPDKRAELAEKILKNIPDSFVNGSGENSGYILNVSFPGIRSEILLHSLESRGIFVSTGSACSSNNPHPSYVLDAMKVDRKAIDGAIRFSFCEEDFDADFVAEVLREEVLKIRKYVR